MSSAWVTSHEKRHLWMYLQALGFEPGPATIACGKIVAHTHLGVNMFDKQNRDAFQIVSYFLFQTLDQSLTKEVFKLCWPPFDQKSDAEFRKHCCEWLKKISAERESSFPQVVGSLFLSPGGPKFIHLMYHFARFVAIKYIKTNSKNSSLHFTELLNLKTQDMRKCLTRCHIARNRFFQVLQREDYIIQKYQENAQLSVKQIRNLRSEYIRLQNEVKKLEPSDDQSIIQEKIQKVRSLWNSVDETLVFLEKEREVVSSVLNFVNQYDLDGTDVVINIPSLLLDKIEKQMCQLHIGNVYEAGKLNLLTVIQLLNEVLKIMKHEHYQADQARPTIDLHYLEKETKFQRERLSDLKRMRCKIKEDLTTIRHSVAEKQGEWYKKWKEFLGLSPFSLIKGWTPVVDLLPPMCPLSFDPVSEEVYAKSILFQYPASLPDMPKQHNQENEGGRGTDSLEAVCDPPNSPAASSQVQPASSSERDSVTLLEKDTKMRTPKEKNEMISKKIPEFEDSPLLDIIKNTDNSLCRGSLLPPKSDVFQKEEDNLVEEVAKAVLSDSSQLSEGREEKLGELIDSVVYNPFLTRNQIPRTPESLITEIRSSWRKAIEMEDKRSTDPSQMDTECRGVLPESLLVLHSQGESSMAIFRSDFDQSCLPEEEVASDCPGSVLPAHVGASYVDRPPAAGQSDVLSEKVICKQDLEFTALSAKPSEISPIESFSPPVHTRIDVLGRSEDKHIKILDHSKTSNEPSVRKTMLYDSLQIPSFKSLRDTDFSILHETLPEEIGCLSLNSSSSSETSFKMESNSPVHNDIFLDAILEERQTTPESDFNLQAIHSRYEALKKSLSKKKEESYLSNSETLERQKLELSPVPKNMQTGDMPNFLDTHDLLSDYAESSLCLSLGERKRSLSPLIKFSPVEQKSKTTVPCSLGELLPNLKEPEILSKSLDAKDSDLTR
ncbi:HAUS augmin-like complex subunit 6 [Ctenodactylus gundi]